MSDVTLALTNSAAPVIAKNGVIPNTLKYIRPLNYAKVKHDANSGALDHRICADFGNVNYEYK
jgi:hypothetical protein